MRRFAIVACLTLASVLVSPATTRSSVIAGNSDAAHACQQGGFLTLTRSDGTGFKNAGECTSYAARGGVIVGVGSACTATATIGCLVLDSVTIREASVSGGTVTYLSATTYTVSGTINFSPTCQNGSTGCSYAVVTITGAGTFSASDGTNTLATGTWTASYSPLDPYDFSDVAFAPTTCASAAIQMVTARLALVWSAGLGGAWLEVRLDSSADGPTKDMVLGNFYASGLPAGYFHTGDVTGVTLTC